MGSKKRRNRAQTRPRPRPRSGASVPSPGKQKQQSTITEPDCPKIKIQYADPAHLQYCGPMVKAWVSVPAAMERALRSAGRLVPRPVDGYLLVDTGASKTSLSEVAAHELGLMQVGFGRTLGVSGEDRQRPIYQARIGIPMRYDDGRPFIMGTETQVLGVADMEKLFDSGRVSVSGVGGEPVRVIGLLGRDFLHHCLLIYAGSESKVEIWAYEQTLARRK